MHAPTDVLHLDAVTSLMRGGLLRTPDEGAAFGMVTRCAAETLGVQRASVWLLTGDGAAIACHDVYDADIGRHSSGGLLARASCPAYFEALDDARVIAAGDAALDPRTRDMRDVYLVPQGIGAMLDAPVVADEVVRGVLCLEHLGATRAWSAAEQSFAVACANLVSLWLAQRGRALSEAALTSTRQQHELVLAAVGEGIHGIDADGRITFENEAALGIFGWERGAMIGRQAHGLVHHHRRDGRPYPVDECPIFRTLQDGEIRRVDDEVFFRKDGSPLPVEYTCAPMLSPAGKVTGAVVSFRDVTERVAARRALDERLKELRCLYRVADLTTRSTQPLDAILLDIASLLPESLQYPDIAAACVSVDAVEHPVGPWADVDPTLRSPIVVGGVEVGTVAVGYTRPQQDAAASAVFLDEEGALVDAVATHISRMIADRQMSDALVRAERLRAVGELTGGIAHDFNNLLQVVLGSTEVLIDALTEDADLRAVAETGRTAAERGAELVGQLLAFARQQPLDPRATDVDALVSGMKPLLQRSLGGHLEIAHRAGASPARALVDPLQFENAILNLCINARDAMADGGEVTITTARAGVAVDAADRPDGATSGPDRGTIVVAVSDTGHGMTPEIAARAFDPFFTTKEVGRGSGLGLSMVYGFIQQSGGRVEIESAPGAGTTVRLYLPEAPETARAGETASPVSGDARGSEIILLVEDNDLVRDQTRLLLSHLGYQVLSAHSGVEALKVLAGPQRIDLLFTDVVMPGGVNGREVAEAARRTRPSLPVLFVSGYSEHALTQDGRLEDGVHLLRKPYRRRDLAQRIRQVLREADGAGG